MPVSLISRTRFLPYHDATITVQEGDWVQATDIVAELDYVPGVLAKIQAARLLSIQPTALSAHVLHSVGDKVEQGEPLATSILFGEVRQVLSPISGYIALISNSLGTIYIRQPVPVGGEQPVSIDLVKEANISKLGLVAAVRVNPGRIVNPETVLVMGQGARAKAVLSPIYGRVESIRDGVITIVPVRARTTLNAYLTGRVQRVIPQQRVVVQALAHVITGVYGVGAESDGEILVVAGADEELAASAVTAEWQGKIVIAGRTASLAVLQAASDVGCAGIVVAHMSSCMLADYVRNNGRPVITGEDELLMPVMLTERFSPVAMRTSVWQQFMSLQGRYAAMSGTTHIRAGLVRPEVVVCEADWTEQLPTSEGVPDVVQVGDLVRLIGSTYRDQIGKVIDLPSEHQVIATGAQVRVAKVALGEHLATVPLPNVLKLQEGGAGDERQKEGDQC